jgi:phage tail sheath protein FI
MIEFEIDDITGAVPLLNAKLRLEDGDNDNVNINEASAIVALEQFSNSETYDINLIACPDFPGERTVISKLIQLCEVQRGDCFAIIDPLQNLNVQQVVEWHNGHGQWANENAINSSYAALYYPWVQIYNQFTESLQWVPPSVKIVSVYAYSDSITEVWFAPSGLNRGMIIYCEKENACNVSDRDFYILLTNCVTPILDLVGEE